MPARAPRWTRPTKSCSMRTSSPTNSAGSVSPGKPWPSAPTAPTPTPSWPNTLAAAPAPPPTAPMTDRPPQPLPANPRPMPPQPKTSDQAMQQAMILRLMEDKQHADSAALPQQASADMQSQLLASDVKRAQVYLDKLGAHARVVPSKDEDYNRGRKWEWDALNQAVARGHPSGLPGEW